ncbi:MULTISPECIES: SRPBCC family protein [Streptomyces]|uniref:SRPBCC family protein n=1 Tax=Streptomyces doebereineriae TaxID=3075528 RepID=A0ABU2V157_9ACTN|nr:SRPBCC family protein [Streptomyces sp. DSM 41640]MDT0479287.1 SRPBCC family protein [Streptomyces sp. DSM 41640]
MREISTYVDIDAKPRIVWEVLTDFARCPDWNPYVREVTGEIRVGGTPALRTQPAKGGPVNFRARVTAVTEASNCAGPAGYPFRVSSAATTASPSVRTTAGRG